MNPSTNVPAAHDAPRPRSEAECAAWQGCLPACAPLANPFVPFQASGSAKYEPEKALRRGTLFEGLDLPFMDRSNTASQTVTPLQRLQALGFAAHELGLYLDTHPDDEEALDLFRSYAATAQQARNEYEAKFGPLQMLSAGEDGSYNWLRGPWPWEFCASEEAD